MSTPHPEPPQPPHLRLEAGAVFAETYTVEERLSDDELGATYRVRNPMGWLLRLHVLPGQGPLGVSLRADLLEHIKELQELMVSGLPSMRDAGAFGETVYLVTDFSPAPTLREIVENDAADPGDWLRLAHDLALILAELHHHDKTHGDVHPDSVTIEARGELSVVGFRSLGLVRRVVRQLLGDRIRARDLVPIWGDSAAYQAPERLQGAPATPESDVWSWATVVFFLVTQSSPFPGESSLEVLSRIQTRELDPVAVLGESDPPGLGRILMRCLQPEPDHRPSLPEVLHEIRAMMPEPPEVEESLLVVPEAAGSEPEAPGRHRIPPVAAAAAGIIIVISTILLLLSRDEDPYALPPPQDSIPRTAPTPERGPVPVAGGRSPAGEAAPARTARSTPPPVDPAARPSRQASPIQRLGRIPAGMEAIPGVTAPDPETGWATPVREPRTRIELVLVPATEERGFLRGAESDDELATSAEQPRHRVRIDRPYYLGRTEVSWRQWQLLSGEPDVPARFPPDPWSDHVDLDHPVVNVSQADASVFCERLGFRLPTEAEWEWACRVSGGEIYPWGARLEDAPTATNLRDQSHLEWLDASTASTPGFDDDFPLTAPVVSGLPSLKYGLYHLGGNVAEWCLDAYHADLYRELKSTLPLNPRTVGEKSQGHTIRGGSFRGGTKESRTTYRRPAFRGRDDVGFRVVLDPVGRFEEPRD